MTCTPDPDVLAFTGAPHQTWRQSFEHTAGVLGTITPGSLIIQIRQGSSGTSDDTLIAAYPLVTGVRLIDVSGMDLAGDPAVFEWEIDAETVGDVTVGETYWIEARATIDGIEGAFLMASRRWYVSSDMAVAP